MPPSHAFRRLITFPPTALFVGVLLAGSVGCSSMDGHVIDGRRLDSMSGEEVVAYARQAHEAGSHEEATQLALYAVNRFEQTSVIEEARFVGGEAFTALEDYTAAFRQYRRLLELRPLSAYRPTLEKLIFDLGTKLLAEEPGIFSDRARAVEVYTFFVAQFNKSPLADDALKLIGDYYFEDEDFELALDYYQRLYREFPASEWRELGLFRIGDCYRLVSKGPDFDRTIILRGREIFRLYLVRYPNGTFAESSALALEEVEGMLARQQLTVGQLYLMRGKDNAARIRLANAALVAPDSPAALEAQALLDERGWDLSMNTMETLERSSRLFGDPFDDQWLGLTALTRESRGLR